MNSLFSFLIQTFKSKQNGFTLIEVLASIVILSIILTSFFSFFGQSLLFSNKNGERIDAYNIARDLAFIVEKKYDRKINKNTFNNIEIKSCNDYDSIINNSIDNLFERSCPFTINNISYYPSIEIEKRTYYADENNEEDTKFSLFLAHIKVVDSNDNLLSETFSYLRECIYKEDDPNVCK